MGTAILHHSGRWSHGRALCVIFFAIACVYANSLSGPFIWDDFASVAQNPVVREGRLSAAFAPLYREQASARIRTPQYFRPLQMISAAADHRIWQLNPFGYHLTNILLHIANAFLVYALFARLFGGMAYPFCAAMLFGLHPAFAPAVAYISGRADLLVLLFSLSAVIFFAKAIESGTLRVPFYVSSLACFALTLASKEIGCAAIVLIAAVDKLRYGYTARKIRNCVYIPFAALLLAWAAFKPSGVPGFSAAGILSEAPGMILSVVKGVCAYAALALVPFHLHMGRNIALVRGFSDPWAWFFLALLGVAAVSVARFRKNRLFLFGIIWFCVPLAAQTAFNYLFGRRGGLFILPEHNLYFCYAGLLAAVFALLSSSAARASVVRRLFPAALVVAAVFAGMTSIESAKWGDAPRLFASIIEYNGKDSPFNAMAYANLGLFHEREMEMAEAEKYLSLAARASGGDPYYYNMLASFYLKGRNADAALRTLAVSRGFDAGYAETYRLSGIARARLGQVPGAKADFETAVRLDPADAVAARWLNYLDNPAADADPSRE